MIREHLELLKTAYNIILIQIPKRSYNNEINVVYNLKQQRMKG